MEFDRSMTNAILMETSLTDGQPYYYERTSSASNNNHNADSHNSGDYCEDNDSLFVRYADAADSCSDYENDDVVAYDYNKYRQDGIESFKEFLLKSYEHFPQMQQHHSNCGDVGIAYAADYYDRFWWVRNEKLNAAFTHNYYYTQIS
jgi:hypothetical protein